MKKFSTIGPDGNLYEFVFLNGRLMRVVISNPSTLVVVYGEYVASNHLDSCVTVTHFENCFKVLCDDEYFTDYSEFMKELSTPINNPEFTVIAKQILFEKRRQLISRIRQMTKAINLYN